MELTNKQVVTIRCAYADLVGAYQAMAQQDYAVHDWRVHRQSIEDLEETFSEIINEPVELPDPDFHD